MPRTLIPIVRIATLAGYLFVSACAVGPDFHRPVPPVLSGYTPEALPSGTGSAPGAGGADQAFISGLDIPGRWWELFKSPALNGLVERALRANPDLAAAKAALRAARENYYAQRGALLPSLGADYNITREQASETPAPPLTSSANPFTLHTAQLNISYVPDLFGGIRRQTESVKAQAEAQRFETEAAYLTLTSNVVSGAIQEASLRDQVIATQRIIAAERDVLNVMQRQKALGQIAGADVAAQEAALAQAEQALPPLEKQLAQQRDLMAALTGHFPNAPPSDGVDLSSLTLPGELPVSLPSKLVDQRPDVRAAEANLQVASAQVGVAIAARLPNVTLTGSAGGAATRLADLFTNGNGFWGVAGDFAEPIFQGGALLHRQRAAEAALDQAKAQYRSTVLTAFQNVADSLQALQADGRALAAAVRAERSAATSLAIARRQLALGQVSGPTVLTAEATYQQAAVSRMQAQTNRYVDTVALFQALGGGWWNRADV